MPAALFDHRRHDAVVSIDKQGRISGWDQYAEAMFGKSLQGAHGKKFCDLLISPDYHQTHLLCLQQFMKAYASRFIKSELEVYDGERHTFPAEMIIAAPDSEQNEGFSILIRDISPLRDALSKRGLLAAIVDSSDDAIVSVSLQDQITSWNAGATRLFGFHSEDAIDKNINIIVPEEVRAERRRIVGEVLCGKKIEHFETVRCNNQGDYIDVNLTISAVRETSGEVTGYSMIMQDITERKIIEKQLRRYVAELERSNRDLEEFSHLASHDMKEPLRGLSTLSTILLEDYGKGLDSEGVAHLSRLNDLCRKMDHVISNLMYFSQLGKDEASIQETDLNEIIEGIRLMIQSCVQSKGARLIVPQRLPTVKCDKTRITEVFRNLITNAIKYNNNDEPVIEIGFRPELRTDRGRETNVFFVKDNGIGIDPKFHKTMFNLFKQTPDTDRDTQQQGTGVGLAFVKRIIERHNGHVWVDSSPGQGSTFYFTLGDKKVGVPDRSGYIT